MDLRASDDAWRIVGDVAEPIARGFRRRESGATPSHTTTKFEWSSAWVTQRSSCSTTGTQCLKQPYRTPNLERAFSCHQAGRPGGGRRS